MPRLHVRAAATAAMAVTLAAAAGPAAAQTEFIVRIYNASAENSWTLEDGSVTAPWLSWGAYAVSGGPNPIFTPGQPAGGNGLENVAEDGVIDKLVNSLSGGGASASGPLTARPVAGQATIFPGGLTRAVFTARPGDRFFFAIMLEQSNDGFYGPGPEGVALFDASGNPIDADVTDQVLFWDAGTEVNQAPGVGPDTGTTEKGPNQGPTENGVVRLMSEVNDGFSYPPLDQVIKVSITPR